MSDSHVARTFVVSDREKKDVIHGARFPSKIAPAPLVCVNS